MSNLSFHANRFHGMKTELEVITGSETKTLKALEAKITKGLGTFMEVGESLAKIRNERLYRAEYRTFESYCQEKWGIGRSYASRLIGAAEVVENLLTTGTKPTAESVVRPLIELKPPEQLKAWTSAIEHAANGSPTAAEVVAAVRALGKRGTRKSVAKPKTARVTLTTQETTVGELIKLAEKRKGRIEIAFGEWRVIVAKLDSAKAN